MLTLSPTERLSLGGERSEAIASLKLADEILASIRGALIEDIGAGDITTNSIVAPEATGTARIIAKQDGVLSGLHVAQATFLLLSPDLSFKPALSFDGDRLAGTVFRVSRILARVPVVDRAQSRV